MNTAPNLNPAHIFEKVKLDYRVAEEQLRKAKAQATEARAFLPPLYVDDLDEHEQALAGRIELLFASDYDIRDLLRDES